MSDEGILEFHEAPESELMKANRRGRPRDTTFDAVVRTAYDSGVAQATRVSQDYVPTLVKGIRNAASHLKVSVSFVTFDPDEDGEVKVEFIAYTTQKRARTSKKDQEDEEDNE